MPPRFTTGPILLTGLAYCASCSCAMTLRTGTSKTGRVYRYYSCSAAARMGKTACKGRSIPMDRLDQLVTSQIADYLLVPDRVADLLAEIVNRRAMAGGEVRGRIDQLSREASTAEDKLRRLYALVEDGVTDLDEVLKVRLADIKADRDRARSALDRIKGQSPAARIDRAKIERFGSLMRRNITTGDVPFRKAYLRSFIDAVEVDDRVIRIHGSKSTLEQAVIASSESGKNEFAVLYANGAPFRIKRRTPVRSERAGFTRFEFRKGFDQRIRVGPAINPDLSRSDAVRWIPVPRRRSQALGFGSAELPGSVPSRHRLPCRGRPVERLPSGGR
jgi:hypothetical protein